MTVFRSDEKDEHWRSGTAAWACVAHAHRNIAKSYHYDLLSVDPPLRLSFGCYPIIASTTDTSSSMSLWCFATIEDDYILLSKLREWGCTIPLFMFGVMLSVWNGVATIPTTLIIRSSDIEYVHQCVTLTPSSFVSPEQAPLVSGVEKINMEREDP